MYRGKQADGDGRHRSRRPVRIAVAVPSVAGIDRLLAIDGAGR